MLFVGPSSPRHLLPGPRVPLAISKMARVFAGGGPMILVLRFVVGEGVRGGSVVGGEIFICGVYLRVGRAEWVSGGGVVYCGLV